MFAFVSCFVIVKNCCAIRRYTWVFNYCHFNYLQLPHSAHQGKEITMAILASIVLCYYDMRAIFLLFNLTTAGNKNESELIIQAAVLGRS